MTVKQNMLYFLTSFKEFFLYFTACLMCYSKYFGSWFVVYVFVSERPSLCQAVVIPSHTLTRPDCVFLPHSRGRQRMMMSLWGIFKSPEKAEACSVCVCVISRASAELISISAASAHF